MGVVASGLARKLCLVLDLVRNQIPHGVISGVLCRNNLGTNKKTIPAREGGALVELPVPHPTHGCLTPFSAVDGPWNRYF